MAQRGEQWTEGSSDRRGRFGDDLGYVVVLFVGGEMADVGDDGVEEGMAIIPSYGLLACRERGIVKSRLVNPVVEVDFLQIRHGGKKLPSIADEFTCFLKNHIASWAGHSGLL